MLSIMGKVQPSFLRCTIFFSLLLLSSSLSTISVERSGDNNRIDVVSNCRRTFLRQCIGGSFSTASAVYILGCKPTNANAASSSSELDISKEKLLNGYKRLNYLLDNWVQETTICGRDDNPYTTGKGCDRTPIKVMDYLGYRNIKDPLFRADKTLQKLEPLIPINRFNEYLEAIEKWSEAAEEGSGMAYISSWGEANPGGGKDRVQLFIERARKNVIDSRDSLAVVIDILGLQP
jgi:hypothetical protein